MADFTLAMGGTFIDPFHAYKRRRKDGGGAASGTALKSVASGVGSMAGVLTKGTLVDIPCAIAEGFRNAPRIYGEEPKDHGRVTGWQSGGVVAAKVSRDCPQPDPRRSPFILTLDVDLRFRLLSWHHGVCDPAI